MCLRDKTCYVFYFKTPVILQKICPKYWFIFYIPFVPVNVFLGCSVDVFVNMPFIFVEPRL